MRSFNLTANYPKVLPTVRINVTAFAAGYLKWRYLLHLCRDSLVIGACREVWRRNVVSALRILAPNAKRYGFVAHLVYGRIGEGDCRAREFRFIIKLNFNRSLGPFPFPNFKVFIRK